MEEVIRVKVARTGEGLSLPLPKRMSEGAAGFDLMAAIKETVMLEPGRFMLIPTGIRIALPRFYEAQIRPRSGLAAKYGVTCLNTPGTIDSDYRGEIKVVLVNLGQKPFYIKQGDRIAQLVINRIPDVELVEVAELDETPRNQGGFGHTGIRDDEQ